MPGRGHPGGPLHERPQRRALFAIDERCEGPAPQLPAGHPDHARELEVPLQNGAGLVEHDVADRGEVEELRVTLEALFDLVPSAAQLVVLHLELDLVHVELVNEVRALVRRSLRLRWRCLACRAPLQSEGEALRSLGGCHGRVTLCAVTA